MFQEIISEYQDSLSSYTPCASITDRKAWEGLDPEWKQETVKLGERYLGFDWPYMSATEFMDFVRTGNRSRFEGRFFSKRRALDALVLAECVENRGRFLDDIINGIYAICDESAWNLPAHNNYYKDGGQQPHLPLPDVNAPVTDLFACETGAVLATVLYLMKPVLDDFSVLIGERITWELNRRIFTPYLTQYSWWMGNGKDKLNNWTVWCTQNVLLTTFLTDTDQELRRQVARKACESVDELLGQYGEDGCCDEGASYYRAAGLCLLLIADVLNSAAGGAFMLLMHTEKIKNIASYIYKVHVADKYYINFADCSAVAGRCTAREYLFAKLTGQTDMAAFAAADYQAGLPDTLLIAEENNLFYRLLNGFTAKELKAFDGSGQVPPPDVFYPSNGLMVVRDKHFVVAAKGGDNADSHNHNDVGSFTIYKNGKPLFVDIGVETYSRKTFSPQRYEIWTMQSAWHNLPTIDGVQQKDGEEYHAENVTCDLEKGELSMDLAAAYPDCALKSWLRTVRLQKGEAVYVQDQFAFRDDEPHEVVLSLITYDRPVPEALTAEGQRVSLVPLEEKNRPAAILEIKGGCVDEVEEVPIEDARLARAWEHSLFRMLVKPAPDRRELALVIR